ncbi:MAG: hypothetical protein HOW73_17365 [Polyangiaceae bacterium]|nr:hypothetical protein [Polyangiaceae bacterium]
MSGVELFSEQALSIEVCDTGAGVRVTWRGKSDIREPDNKLIPFLDQLAERLKNRKVTIDFRRFEYMNSATVSPIIRFVRRLDRNAASTVLVYDPLIDWQRVNFLCMKTIARTLAHVEVLTS